MTEEKGKKFVKETLRTAFFFLCVFFLAREGKVVYVEDGSVKIGFEFLWQIFKTFLALVGFGYCIGIGFFLGAKTVGYKPFVRKTEKEG